jgi:O-antigen/teichoic acid export membrane protein
MLKLPMPKLFSDTSLLFLSSLLVNAGNYVFNLLLGRMLLPAEFAEANFFVSLLLGLSFVATAFQLTATKYNLSSQQGIKIGLMVSLVLTLGAEPIRVFFQLSSTIPILLIAACIPFYFSFSIRRGQLQGMAAFRTLAATYQVEMWVRFIIGIGLVWAGAASMGVSVGLLASLVITYWFTKKQKSDNQVITKEYRSFFAIILLYELSQILINNGDTWLVKHYFNANEAGQYAALSLIGRVVYFGTWSVVMVLFPKVIATAKAGQPTQQLFMKALLIVIAIASGIVLASKLFPTLIVGLLLGNAYQPIASYLWLYASLTALFAVSNVFVYYYLSLNRFTPVVLSVGFGFVQLLSIHFFHQNFEQVIGCQLICMTGLLMGLVIYALFINASKCNKYQSAMSFMGKVTAAK